MDWSTLYVKAVRERDEAVEERNKLRAVLISILQPPNNDQLQVPNNNNAYDAVVAHLTTGRPLPLKGKLLQAVVDVGPLLIDIFPPPLPVWNNPPPPPPHHHHHRAHSSTDNIVTHYDLMLNSIHEEKGFLDSLFNQQLPQ